MLALTRPSHKQGLKIRESTPNADEVATTELNVMQENPSSQPPEVELSSAAEASPDAASAELPENASIDTMPGIEEQLRQAELKGAEHYDAWLRAKAEVVKSRRRAQEANAMCAYVGPAPVPLEDYVEQTYRQAVTSISHAPASRPWLLQLT